jgi:hypothetical protein
LGFVPHPSAVSYGGHSAAVNDVFGAGYGVFYEDSSHRKLL